MVMIPVSLMGKKMFWAPYEIHIRLDPEAIVVAGCLRGYRITRGY